MTTTPKPQDGRPLRDRPLIAALVVCGAALLAYWGIDVTDPERLALEQALAALLAGVSGVVVVARSVILRAKNDGKP